MEDLTDPLTALADETRIAILRTLADADGPLAFTELRRRAGVDDAGRFNYHLSRLCEYFVREVEGGYELGHAGKRIVTVADGAESGETATRVDRGANGEAASYVDLGEAGEAGDGCPVCGERECDRWFHVHLDLPWR